MLFPKRLHRTPLLSPPTPHSPTTLSSPPESPPDSPVQIPVWIYQAQPYNYVLSEQYYADSMSTVTDEDEDAAEISEIFAAEGWRTVRGGTGVVSEENGKRRFTERDVHGREVGSSVSSSSSSSCSVMGGQTEELRRYTDIEVLFDAETPLPGEKEERTWEDVEWKGVFWDTTSADMKVFRVPAPYEAPQESEYGYMGLDEGEIKTWPRISTHGAGSEVVGMMDNYSAVSGEQQHQRQDSAASGFSKKREGRRLTYTLLTPIANNTAGGGGQDEVTQLERQEDFVDEPLQYDSIPDIVDCSPPLLPGIEHLSNIESRSAFIQYNHNVESLHEDSVAFLDEYYQHRYNFLDKDLDSWRLPGENFLLAENDVEYGFSIERPTAQSVFDLIDRLVHADMLDDCEEILTKEPVESGRRTGAMITPGSDTLFYETSRALCASPPSTVLDTFDDREEDGVLEITEIDLDSSSQFSEHHYIDAKTQQRISYTALNHLLQSEW